MSTQQHPTTLGALKRSPYAARAKRTVKDELRENLLERLAKGGPLFEGVIGYEETVLPQLVNAVYSAGSSDVHPRESVGRANLLCESVVVQRAAATDQEHVTGGRLSGLVRSEAAPASDIQQCRAVRPDIIVAPHSCDNPVTSPQPTTRAGGCQPFAGPFSGFCAESPGQTTMLITRPGT